MKHNETIVAKAQLALNNVLLDMPHLAGLVSYVHLQLDERIETAGVFASGRMLFNPHWLEKMSLVDATFVMAHELMHLVLMTHDRAGESDAQLINVAHDVIINQMLEKTLGMKTPLNGLTYKKVIQKASWYRFEGDAGIALEEVTSLLQPAGEPAPKTNTPCWDAIENSPVEDTMLGDALQNVLKQKKPKPTNVGRQISDVMTEEEEQRLFPGEKPAAMVAQASIIRKEVIEAISKRQIQIKIAVLTGAAQGKGSEGAEYTRNYQAIKHHYTPPWQWALQQWMEATAPGKNTYSRSSRRGEHSGFVRPGRERIGHALHIVLDTSGSMTSTLSRILGAIASFCEATGVETAHVIQCDVHVTSDDWLTMAELENFEAKGFGGSDMSPGMERLAEDPDVERVIVLTDGYIDFPRNGLPYEVLWVLTADHEWFNPGYGQVIGLAGAE